MDLSRVLLPVLVSLSVFSTSASSGSAIWIDEPVLAFEFKNGVLQANNYRYLRVNRANLETAMYGAPLEKSATEPAYIDLPLPDGEMHTFAIEESPIIVPELRADYPDFKTYKVRSANNSAITGRLDLLPTGFHGYLSTGKGTVFIDPDANNTGYYRSYYKHDQQLGKPREFSCGVTASPDPVEFLSRQPNGAARFAFQQFTYRLAVAATFEYSQAVAPGPFDIPATQAEITTAINRVNEIFNLDLGINLQLVLDDDLISDTVDELPDSDPFALLTGNQAFIEAAITSGDYDIGHVFSTGGGGLAGLGVACDNDNSDGQHKAQGVTGLPSPTGDAYYIDFVAHELGHQFSANHTFNGTTDSCGGGNRNATTAFEPGSGVTIMGYAGICGAEDVQSTAVSPSAGGISEDTFHAGSINEIDVFTSSGLGSTCAVIDNMANVAPVVDAGTDFTIPGLTPFNLNGSATDTDALTYQWDEMDIGSSTNSASFGDDLGDNPLFRSFAPSNIAIRTLPRIETIIAGVDDKAERLPSLDRTMKFRLTVRDGNRGVSSDDVQVTVDEDSGPFRVLSAASAVILDTDQPQVIEWNAACSELAPVSCADVDILLSTDSGMTFGTTLLAATANDGEETVTFPNVTTTTALIKIACSNNTFFDVNDSFITLASGSGTVLTSTGAGGSHTCGTASTGGGGGGGGSGATAPVFDVSGATSVDINTVIDGSVDDTTNDTEVFGFTATDEVYTIVLGAYDTSDLDLHLTDSNGVTLLQSTGTGTTETIRVPLVSGVTYFLVVTAKDTGGAAQSYSITTTVSKKPVAGSDDDSSTLSLNLWFLLVLAVYRLYGLRRNNG